MIQYGISSSKSDVWSFGICCWELFNFGKLPYQGMTNADAVAKVMNGNRLECPSNCPDAVYSVMLACWQIQSDARPSFREIQSRIKLPGQQNSLSLPAVSRSIDLNDDTKEILYENV